jgi:arginase
MTTPPLVVIGAPTSAGSYAAGQEQAPTVLRERRLLDALRSRGRDVTDAGDGPLQVWSPDRGHPLAQNVDDVARAVRFVASMARPAFDDGARLLVIGGNCTIALGVMAALDPSAALIYVDRHYDLNTPDSTTDGALDWMGMAYALGVADGLGTPVLDPANVHYLGISREATTQFERDQVDTLGLRWGSSEALASDPLGEISGALAWVGARAFAVHVDVDVLDFTDAPLAENTDGRNTGPKLAALALVLREACAHPGFRALSIGELNPSRSAGDPDAIPRFIRMLADALA